LIHARNLRTAAMPEYQPPRSNTPGVPSPCVRNCCLNGDDVCMGCGRSLEEILQWHNASDEQRISILERARLRCEQRRDFTPKS